MACDEEYAVMLEKHDALADFRDSFFDACEAFLIADAAAIAACAAAAATGGANVPADLACAAAVAAALSAYLDFEEALEELAVAEGEYEAYRIDYKACVASCPSWAWATPTMEP